VPAQSGGATGEDGAPRLRLPRAQRVSGEVGRTEGAQYLGQAPMEGHRASVRQGIEQLQGRGGAGQATACQMQVAHGGADMAVAEQALQRGQIDPGLQ